MGSTSPLVIPDCFGPDGQDFQDSQEEGRGWMDFWMLVFSL